LKVWNFNSTLKNAVSTILAKLEGGVSSNVGNFGNVGGGMNQPSNVHVPNNNMNVDRKDNKEDDISNELVKDLNSKSLEELIFIYYNEEDYIFEFTNKLRQANMNSIQ